MRENVRAAACCIAAGVTGGLAHCARPMVLPALEAFSQSAVSVRQSMVPLAVVGFQARPVTFVRSPFIRRLDIAAVQAAHSRARLRKRNASYVDARMPMLYGLALIAGGGWLLAQMQAHGNRVAGVASRRHQAAGDSLRVVVRRLVRRVGDACTRSSDTRSRSRSWPALLIVGLLGYLLRPAARKRRDRPASLVGLVATTAWSYWGANRFRSDLVRRARAAGRTERARAAHCGCADRLRSAVFPCRRAARQHSQQHQRSVEA